MQAANVGSGAGSGEASASNCDDADEDDNGEGARLLFSAEVDSAESGLDSP